MTGWTIVYPMENHITSIYQLAFLIAFSFFVVVYLFLPIPQVRIRESNFHSSLIQGPQNFDTTIQSGGVVGGDGAATKSSQNHPKLKKPPQRAAVNPSSNSDSTSQSDSKMPVEQLTSHVLSSASKNTRIDYLNHLAVNLIILLIVKFY